VLISRIDELIKKSGLRPGYIAGVLRTERQTVTNWAKGRSYPNMEKGFELSRLLGVTVEDLYLYVNMTAGKYKTKHKKSGKMYVIEFKNGQATAFYFDKNDVFHERPIKDKDVKNYEFVKEMREGR
jgi:DNA-binding XRE family transcriptional regulator